ncbi:carboxylate-amine ligase [Rhodoligotrophos appendicifer]|uniref:carboxylate-amine ligase n=1 Tax=Rhodoligotrophos appendicifer TaxID=987056 RepID=UPI00196179B6|nr:carboxylate-amine ligase [Rhodoligotrophos appendicifer]
MAHALIEPSFSLGIEEEYLLVDAKTRDLIHEAPKGLLAACERRLLGQVSPEFLQCQIEVGTRVCSTMDEARTDLAHLRRTIADTARDHGLAPIAASTHPFARWDDQRHTHRDRYEILAKDLQVVVQRMLICGMHVHVAVEDEDLRIDLFNQLVYFLPHLLMLTTSSPFWQGRNTGLASYRLIVFDSLPRTGLPPQFSSFADYQRTVATLTSLAIVEDATKIWWDLRPSGRFPTLELRICDVCTRLDDAIAVAALFRCLVRMLFRLRRDNQRWRSYERFLVNENRWRALRYGASQGLIDFGRGEIVPSEGLLEELLILVRPDAEHFGGVAEVEHCRTILQRGTSAVRQISVFEAAKRRGLAEDEALAAVVDDLISQTVADFG